MITKLVNVLNLSPIQNVLNGWLNFVLGVLVPEVVPVVVTPHPVVEVIVETVTNLVAALVNPPKTILAVIKPQDVIVPLLVLKIARCHLNVNLVKLQMLSELLF